MVADIFLELRDTWEHLVPWHSSGSLGNVEALFNAVHAVMASNLRSMVEKTLSHILVHFEEYKVFT